MSKQLQALESSTPTAPTTLAPPAPSETRAPTAARELVRALRAHGVDRVFGIPGGTIAPVLDALIDSEIEYVVCQHETMAVYAASGFAEATGKPGVVLVTSGPGVLNAVTGLAAACHGEVPLLLLGGEIARRSSGRGALQDGGPAGLDLQRALAPFIKGGEAPQFAPRVAIAVEQAMALALSAPAGPVFLRLPVDVMGASGGGRVARTSPTRAPAPDLDLCAEIAERLQSAAKPVLWAGVGARRARVAGELRRLAEASGCLVVTDVEAKGIFPESHPLSRGIYGVGGRGDAASLLSEGVDLLIAVGARFDDTTTNNFSPAIERVGALVQLDHDPRRLARAYAPAIAMHCDLPTTLAGIADALVPRSLEGATFSSQALAERPCPGPLGRAPHDPRAIVHALQRVLGPDAVFSCDIGNHMLFAATGLTLEKPDSFYVSNGLGGMGSGIGYAIGLQLGLGRDRPVVAVCGDGGVLMVGNELATCAKYRIPTLFVVFNDGHLNMVQHGLGRIFGRSLDFRTPAVDFCAYARSLGVEATRLDDARDLERLGDRPLDRPYLIEVPIDPACRAANPREDTVNFNFPDRGATAPRHEG